MTKANEKKESKLASLLKKKKLNLVYGKCELFDDVELFNLLHLTG